MLHSYLQYKCIQHTQLFTIQMYKTYVTQLSTIHVYNIMSQLATIQMCTTYVYTYITIQMYKTYVTQLYNTNVYNIMLHSYHNTDVYNIMLHSYLQYRCIQHNVTQLSTIQMYTT